VAINTMNDTDVMTLRDLSDCRWQSGCDTFEPAEEFEVSECETGKWASTGQKCFEKNLFPTPFRHAQSKSSNLTGRLWSSVIRMESLLRVYASKHILIAGISAGVSIILLIKRIMQSFRRTIYKNKRDDGEHLYYNENVTNNEVNLYQCLQNDKTSHDYMELTT
ncbi:hypothetical protein MAR_028996, partial [Mya arenaria]